MPELTVEDDPEGPGFGEVFTGGVVVGIVCPVVVILDDLDFVFVSLFLFRVSIKVFITFLTRGFKQKKTISRSL